MARNATHNVIDAEQSAKTERVQIVASRSWVDLVENWRAAQHPVPNFSAAIRQLVLNGLESEGTTRSER